MLIPLCVRVSPLARIRLEFMCKHKIGTWDDSGIGRIFNDTNETHTHWKRFRGRARIPCRNGRVNHFQYAHRICHWNVSLVAASPPAFVITCINHRIIISLDTLLQTPLVPQFRDYCWIVESPQNLCRS